MSIVITLAGPSTRASHALGVCSGQMGVMRPSAGKPFAGDWFGTEPPVAVRTRPDAVSILDPHTASAPRRWSP